MPIYCDTHVHCYDFSEFETVLDRAYENITGQSFDVDNDALVLFFTDGIHDKTWSKLITLKDQRGAFEYWKIEASSDSTMLIARHQDTKAKVHLMAARQLNSSERLEFLVLGFSGDDDDGETGQSIVERLAHEYLLICPWGVGKWLFSRGKILSDLIRKYPTQLYLGDNGGRPKVWASIPHFRQTKMPILNGSDPLPIKGELKRVASFGVFIEAPIQGLNTRYLISLLKDSKVTKKNFGRPLGLIDFIKGRIALFKAKRS